MGGLPCYEYNFVEFWITLGSSLGLGVTSLPTRCRNTKLATRLNVSALLLFDRNLHPSFPSDYAIGGGYPVLTVTSQVGANGSVWPNPEPDRTPRSDRQGQRRHASFRHHYVFSQQVVCPSR